MKIPVKTDEKIEQETDELKGEHEVQESEERAAEEAGETPAQASNDDEHTVVEESSEEEALDESSQETVSGEEEETPEEEDEMTRLQKQLEAKEQEAKEHYDARLRLQAEFDNFKKRKEKETFEFRKYANQDFIRELLVVVDDFDRSIVAAEQTHKLEDFLKGVELIFNKFLGILKKKGVKEIETAAGQPFNPEIHEAMTQIETDEIEEGMVAQVFQKGYYLHDRVLLAVKVAVAKNTES